MTHDVQQVVSAAGLDSLIENVAKSVTDRAGGVFGPASTTWRVNRESALFLAAGRAALLQLAHPQVTAALAEHSRTLKDPIGRFHQTFRVIFTMVFGTLDDALTASRQLHRRHTTIGGTMPETVGTFAEGSRYEANRQEALRWVYATLVESAVIAYELVLPPLSAADREGYYLESRKMAALFGIPAGALPTDWTGFCGYNEGMLRSDTLAVSATARDMAHALLAGAGSWARSPNWYRALTAQIMPARLRNEFGLVYADRDERLAGMAIGWLRRVYPRLPAVMRFVGPYRQARARLAGTNEQTSAIRLSNRFWMGQNSIGHPMPRGQQ